MDRAIRVNRLRPATGLVDYLAEGLIYRGAERIPCEIGYIEETSDEVTICKAAYIFIKRDGVTDSGYCYHKETIKLEDNTNYHVLNEEV